MSVVRQAVLPEALAHKNWSVMDILLFNEAIVGWASPSHAAPSACGMTISTQNTDRQWLAWLPSAGPWQLPPALQAPLQSPGPQERGLQPF